MSFFKPSDFQGPLIQGLDNLEARRAANCANAKRDEALEEARKIFKKLYDCRPMDNMWEVELGLEWIKKYGAKSED